MFGVQFVVGVGIQAAEAIVAGFIGDIRLYGLRREVDQVNDGGGNGIVAAIDHASVDGAQLRFRLLVLRPCGGELKGAAMTTA